MFASGGPYEATDDDWQGAELLPELSLETY